MLDRLAVAHSACTEFARSISSPPSSAINELASALRLILSAKVVAIRESFSASGSVGIAPAGIEAIEWLEALGARYLHPPLSVVTISVHADDPPPPLPEIDQIVLVPLLAKGGHGMLCLAFGETDALAADELTCIRLLGEHLALAASVAAQEPSLSPEAPPSPSLAASPSSNFDINELVSIAAHELRTPLTPITMLLQSLERKARGGTIDVEAIVRSRKQVNRLTVMIADLLDLSRLHEHRLVLSTEPFELGSVVEEAVNEHLQNDPRHRVLLTRSPAPLTIVGDRSRVLQSILSLIQHVTRMTIADTTIVAQLVQDGPRAVITLRGEPPPAPSSVPSALPPSSAPPSSRKPQPRGLAVHLAEALTVHQGGTVSISSARGEETRVMATYPLAPSEVEPPG